MQPDIGDPLDAAADGEGQQQCRIEQCAQHGKARFGTGVVRCLLVCGQVDFLAESLRYFGSA